MKNLVPLLVTAAIAATPASALAKGKDPAPAPTPNGPAVACDFAADGPTADGGYIASNQAAEAGCLSVIINGDWNSIRVYDVKPSPGWTYKITYNGVGQASTVRVDFEKGKQKRSVMMEFGKTVIK